MTTNTNNIIRQLRHRTRLTGAQLSARLIALVDQPGCTSVSWISDIENERDGPPCNATVRRVANACCLSVGYFPPDGWRILPEDSDLPESSN